MVIDDSFYMQLAIDEAWKYQLLTYPNPAVGCAVVKNGRLLAVEAHQEAGMPHAEVNALKSAFLSHFQESSLRLLASSAQIHEFLSNNHNNFFEDCTIYVTLEPCNHFGKTPPCATLLSTLKPKRIVIGIKDPNNIASGGINTLEQHNIALTIGVLADECHKLLSPFLIAQETKRLNVFKIAQRLDGSFDGGYISSSHLLEFVHKLRTKIDLLCIGGNTVRTDRPTLDCRLITKETAPNICIFSQQTQFDPSIALFQVPNRTVEIKNNFSILDKKRSFSLIEGGDNLFKLAYNHIDILLVLVSLSYSDHINKFFGDTKLVHLYTQKIGSELLVWFKKGI